MIGLLDRSYHVVRSGDRYAVEVCEWFIDRHGEKDSRTDMVAEDLSGEGAVDLRNSLTLQAMEQRRAARA